MSAAESLLEVVQLKKYVPATRSIFGRTTGWVRAVDDVSFTIRAGETLGLVGETGCGKTTLGRAVVRLLEPTSGRVLFRGQDLGELSRRELRAARRDLQIIFQDPARSLNPRLTAGAIIEEGLAIHRIGTPRERLLRVVECMERVGLNPGDLRRHPHEFSAGQRQRIGIARALAVEPALIVCDEPVSALDVSLQAQIINLLIELRRASDLAYLFVAHDVSVLPYLCDRVAVMYLGEIVEFAPCVQLYRTPLHPYTRALFSAVPVAHPSQRRARADLGGDVPSALEPPPGCRFHPRCPLAVKALCDVRRPSLVEVDGHGVACHVVEEERR
jgi:peptide/nickel transport system ATP-binding protein/oligopeptide transport system ATP-binding protein